MIVRKTINEWCYIIDDVYVHKCFRITIYKYLLMKQMTIWKKTKQQWGLQ